MKKFLLKCCAVLALGSVATSAMAVSGYQSSIISIQDALSKTRFSNTLSRGFSTVITVINYTENTIVVDQPDGAVLTRLTSDRIINPDYSGQTNIVLRDYATGNVFFPVPGHSGLVSPFAVVSVYVSNHQYVVYVTE